MLNMNRKLSRIRNRDGISIIEVLTSMAVATIGVFGVMVMIPFAIRQSQLGLDNDAANALGRDAIEELQIQGYLTADSTGNLQRIDGFTGTPAIMHFDPIGFDAGVADETVGDVLIDRVTGLNLLGNVLARGEAVQLCSSADDIQHADPDAEGADQLGPPEPIFDVDGGGANIKRQSSGRITWSTMLVPENGAGTPRDTTPVHRFRTHTLVYEARFPETYAANLDNYAVDEINSINAGPQPVNQIVLDAGQTPGESIRRDDWIMLINNLKAMPTDPDTAYDAQVMFARVLRVDGNTVTVDGGPFNYGTAGMPIETEMVFLRNVVNVFERSVAIED